MIRNVTEQWVTIDPQDEPNNSQIAVIMPGTASPFTRVFEQTLPGSSLCFDPEQ